MKSPDRKPRPSSGRKVFDDTFFCATRWTGEQQIAAVVGVTRHEGSCRFLSSARQSAVVRRFQELSLVNGLKVNGSIVKIEVNG